MSQTQLPPKVASARRSPPVPPPAPQEDRGRFLLAAGLWSLAIVVLTAFGYRQFFAPPNGTGLLMDPDAMDYAQIARNMASGHGFATGILRPLAVSGYAGPDHSGTAADVSRAPLYPFLLMLMLMARGGRGGDVLVVAVSLALFLLCVVAVYRLARTFFPAPGQAWIALLSAGLYGVGGEALKTALVTGPVVLATLLVTALLIALYRAAETPDRPAGFGGALWVGFLLGLCYLTQYSLLLLAPPVLVYLFFSRASSRAWPGVGAAVLGFLIAAGPWMARNAHLSHGDPFFTLLFYGVMAQTPDYPGATTIYRSVVPPVGPLAYFYTHLPAMLPKLGSGLTYYRDHLLQAFNVFLLAAAAASLLWRTRDVRVSAVRACAFIVILAIVVISSLFLPAVQMIAPFAPLVCVVAVGFVFSLVAEQDWDPFLRRTALWTLGLLIGLGSAVEFVGQRPPPPDFTAQGLQVWSNSHASKGATISDAPWELAWRGGMPAIWLPADNAAYQNVKSAAGQSGIYITDMLLTPTMALYADDPDEAPAWEMLVRNPQAYDNTQRVVKMSNSEIKSAPQFRAVLQQYTPAQVRQGYALDYTKNYGPISDILTDFADFNSVAEADKTPSTYFVHR